ncbi:MAG: VCBS repeat-containing protein [Planctomycetales bacterium]|nr:VCBS repeat-containing protein [Planctomycetales bacterium]
MNRKEFPRTEQLEARKLLTGVEFVPTAKLITNSYEVSVDVADFDADGDLDVVFAERGSGAIRWQQNLDEGSFADSQTVAWATDPQDIVATDLDEDGQSDLAVLADNRLSLFQANSDSGWVRRAEYSSQQSISNLQFGSINGQTQNIVLQTGDASITVLTQRENRFDFVPLQSIPFAEKVVSHHRIHRAISVDVSGADVSTVRKFRGRCWT